METFSTGFVATADAETFSGSGEASVGVVAGALARVSVEAGETAWDTGASDKGSREAAPPSSAANFKEMLWYTEVTGFSRDCGGKRIQRAATTSHTTTNTNTNSTNSTNSASSHKAGSGGVRSRA